MSILLHIHNVSQGPSAHPIGIERRFEPHSTTLNALLGTIERLTGIPPSSQSLSISVPGGNRSVSIPPTEHEGKGGQTLAELGFEDEARVEVRDGRPTDVARALWSEDAEREMEGRRFELNDEEYAARQDTVLAFKKRNKIGRFADGASVSSSDTSNASSQHVAKPEQVVGARCEVQPDAGKGEEARRGTIRFVGATQFGGGGDWIGVDFDEPDGKGDGRVAGVRYFTCRAPHGGFVRPERVVVGNFKTRLEEELEDEDEDEEI